jgi:hypothetical protein
MWYVATPRGKMSVSPEQTIVLEEQAAQPRTVCAAAACSWNKGLRPKQASSTLENHMNVAQSTQM